MLKTNPVNDWVAPVLTRALAPLLERGYLRIVSGGAEVGAALVAHAEVDTVHLTGSDRTHDAIVWGAPGAEQQRRRAFGRPLLGKPITSELGNVSPVCVVPGDYSLAQLRFQADNLAAMLTNNAGFNCNAARVLVTAARWPQRERFLGLLIQALERVPLRNAYYPGAFDRYETVTGGGHEVLRVGHPRDGQLPWTLVRGLDPAGDEPLFREEAFCPVLGEVGLPAAGAPEFLEAATELCNDRLWGTLNAMLVVPADVERRASTRQCVEAAVRRLRYGTVAINAWPALAYGLATPPWGGHPTGSPADVQSGIGFTHNSFLLEGVEKTVLRGPLTTWPTPAWFPGHRRAHHLGRALLAMEARPGWGRLAGLFGPAIRG